MANRFYKYFSTVYAPLGEIEGIDMRMSLMRALWLLPALAAAGSAFAQTAGDQPVRIERINADIELQSDGRYLQISEQQARLQTQAGVQQASQMVFGYNVSMQRFEVLQAYTQKADGRRIEVKKDAIFTRDLPASTGAPMFADAKVVVVVFPEVAVGDSVYARVRVEQAEPMFPGHYSNLFYITPYALIDQNRITLRAPSAVRLQIDNEGYSERRSEDSGNITYEWSTQQTTIEPFEPGSISALDYSRRLSMSTFGGFSEFAKAYAARADDKAQVTLAIRKLADELTTGVPGDDKREQARRVYDWVAQNIRYVGIFLGVGAVVPHAAEQVLVNRYGDCKDHVTLLTALLAAKGIEARTAIISGGDSFWIGKLPLLENFNHVIAYLPALDLFVDPTSNVTSFGHLPAVLQGKTVVIVSSGELKRTPVDRNTDNVTARRVMLEIQDDGTISGKTVIESRGVRAETYRAVGKILTAERMPDYVRSMTTGERFKGDGSVEFTGTNDRSDAMRVSARYMLSGGIDWPGNGSFEVPAGFFGYEHMSSQVRRNVVALKRPVYAGVAETLIEEYEIKLPARMNLIALPRDVSFKNEVASYDATYRRQGQTLVVTRKLVDLYPGPVVPPTMFKAAEDKSAVIARDLRAQIVYQSQ